MAICYAMGTPALVEYLKNDANVDRVWRCLQPLLDGEAVANRRVFLSAYLMVCNPDAVFENQASQPQELIALARSMLEQFEDMVYGTAVENQTLEMFRNTVRDFYTQFEAWRVVDRAQLKPRIENMVWMLLQAKQTLPAGDPNHALLDAQIARLVLLYRRIGVEPAATQALLAAVAAFGGPALPLPPPGE